MEVVNVIVAIATIFGTLFAVFQHLHRKQPPRKALRRAVTWTAAVTAAGALIYVAGGTYEPRSSPEAVLGSFGAELTAIPRLPLSGASAPILDVRIAKQEVPDGPLLPLGDGDLLRSGSGGYLMHLVPATVGYLYVFVVDSAGKVYWLFPRNRCEFSEGTNPVDAGSVVLLPGGGQVYNLDNLVGVERIFVVFTAARRHSLETSLASATSSTQLLSASANSKVQLVQNRGIASTRPVGPYLSAAGGSSLVPAGANYSAIGEGFVLERWFVHVN